MEDFNFDIELEKNKNLVVDEDSNSWLVSYSDIISVLLIFFIIFFAIKQKFNTVENSELQQIVMALNKGELGGKGIDEIKEMIEKVGELKKTILADINLKDLKLEENGDQLKVIFERVEFFRPGSTKLTEEGLLVINNFIKAIKPCRMTATLS